MGTYYRPRINPIQYTQVGFANVSQYVSKHMDDFPFEETILPWQQKTKYYQSWQTSDTIKQHVISSVAPITLKVLDEYGQAVFTDNFGQVGTTNAYGTGFFIYEYSLSLSAYADGIYFLQIIVGDLTEVSEPQIFSSNIPDSLLIEYKNNRYFSGVVFETGFYPSIRVPGTLRLKQPASKDTVYEDQILSMTLLNSKPYRLWSLSLGSSLGIPDYLIDKLNFILGCSTLSIDGRDYTKNDGAKLEVSEEENYPMRGWTIELREKVNSSSKIYDGLSPVSQDTVIMSVDTTGFSNSNTGSEYQVQDVNG